MINRHTLATILILLAGLAAGYFAAGGIIDFLAIRFEAKDLSQLSYRSTGKKTEPASLPIRIVDLGGVGILPDSARWGENYEHNQHYFEDVMLVNPPFIDTASFSREARKLQTYVERMAGFGYNAIAMPWFLEFINFDLVGNGKEVYGRESIYRHRHDTLTRKFGELMQLSADAGLKTYLWTDMVALTPPLETFLVNRFGAVDAERGELWKVYEKAAEEAFLKFPNVAGFILRIGEAGSVYNKPGWDYRSELLVRTEGAVKLMLKGFLAAAEKHDRTIIFRTWSVGVGQIGDMHTNPATYQKVLGSIQSGHLVVSTKYASGDFYSWLRFNPTLYQGAHRRIVEFQAKREFEGFGAIPNYVASLHQAALQSILEKNHRLEGAWVWTQYGGPLRAGPLIIYPFHGFNVINDVNVYASSRLLVDPYEHLDSITSDWIRGYFGTDAMLVDTLTEFLNTSYEVMQKGLYISQFAKYDVRALGLEPPPMLWIFEWDILGASSAVFSNIYHITRGHFQQVIDEGFEAVRGAAMLKDQLLEVRDRVSMNLEAYDQLLASVDYEIELFRLLDYYRQFMMHYYRWIDTGDLQSKATYRLAMGQFKSVMNYHDQKFGDDLNTLGMDFEEAKTGIAIAEKNGASVTWAKIVVAIAIFLLILGIPGIVRDRAHRRFAGTLYFDALFRPWQIQRSDAYHGTRRLVFFLVLLYLFGWFVFTSFSAFWFPLSIGILGLLYAGGLALLLNRGRNFMKILASILAPKVIMVAFVLVLVAIRGPQYFWYQFWISDIFKLIFLSLFIMLFFRKIQIYVVLGRRWSHLNGAGSASLVFFMLGFQFLLAGWALGFFGLEESLTALNNELLLLPGGLSKIMGITTHLGIPMALPAWIKYIAAGLMTISLPGIILSRQSRSKAVGYGLP